MHMVQQVLSTFLVLLFIHLIHSEEQIPFNCLPFTLLFHPIRIVEFSVKESNVLSFL